MYIGIRIFYVGESRKISPQNTYISHLKEFHVREVSSLPGDSALVGCALDSVRATLSAAFVEAQSLLFLESHPPVRRETPKRLQ